MSEGDEQPSGLRHAFAVRWPIVSGIIGDGFLIAVLVGINAGVAWEADRLRQGDLDETFVTTLQVILGVGTVAAVLVMVFVDLAKIVKAAVRAVRSDD